MYIITSSIQFDIYITSQHTCFCKIVRQEKWANIGISKVKQNKGLPREAELAQGVPGRLRPRIFLTFQHYKGGRSSDKRTGRLNTRRNPWYLLTSGHMFLWGYHGKNPQ